MSLPANIRVNVAAPFPTLVYGSGPITINKANGIWTVGFDFTKIATVQNPPLPNYPTDYILGYDSVAKAYFFISLSNLVQTISSIYRTITVAGDVTVLPSDVTILMDKTVGAATNIFLPASSTRLGTSLTIKDYKGDANTNNITLVPAAGETIDGLSAANAITAGIALVDTNYGKRTLFPLASGGWYS